MEGLEAILKLFIKKSDNLDAVDADSDLMVNLAYFFTFMALDHHEKI
jgi:hypothetical protein